MSNIKEPGFSFAKLLFWCAFFVHTNGYFASQGEFWSVSYQKRQQFQLEDRYYCRMVAIPITTHVRQTITHFPFTNWRTYLRRRRFSPSWICLSSGCDDASFCFWTRGTGWPVWWLLGPYSLIVRELFCYEFQYRHWVEVLAICPPAWDMKMWSRCPLAWVATDGDELPSIDTLPFPYHYLW